MSTPEPSVGRRAQDWTRFRLQSSAILSTYLSASLPHCLPYSQLRHLPHSLHLYVISPKPSPSLRHSRYRLSVRLKIPYAVLGTFYPTAISISLFIVRSMASNLHLYSINNLQGF
ncbi:hypothetical protein DPEC_G00073270 [Dallia pectoralis]|uniref:Uncharacterized protein n=1 Tax=Dallia pectoralis TaxID=75939 RepID=A0ACC2H2T4_DALPE|nr:hypothetical protein DPEC_G00073270 [Dallia pectoralis]